jgi:hypothetical protein
MERRRGGRRERRGEGESAGDLKMMAQGWRVSGMCLLRQCSEEVRGREEGREEREVLFNKFS